VKSTCATCGYSWPTGQDGSHSCTRVLLVDMVKLRAENDSLRLALAAEKHCHVKDSEHLIAQRDRLADALVMLIDPEPCSYTPSGLTCSTHGQSKPCVFDIARAALPLSDEEQRHK
jgi:hypothetical protein